VLEVLSPRNAPSSVCWPRKGGRPHPSEAGAGNGASIPRWHRPYYARHSYPFFATLGGASTWRGLPLLVPIRGARPWPVLLGAPSWVAWCNDQRLQVSGCSDLASVAAGHPASPTNSPEASPTPNVRRPSSVVHPPHPWRTAWRLSGGWILAFVAAGASMLLNAGSRAGNIRRRCGAR